MIIGVGCDVIDIRRIEEMHKKFGQKLLEKILTNSERRRFYDISDTTAQISFIAKRFSAKEAIAKAFGCGIGSVLSFQDIEILNNEAGAPKVLIRKMPMRLKQEDICIHISISDEWPIAISFIVISRLVST